MMTEEHLQELTQEVNEELDRLASLERPLTDEEKKRQKTYRIRKYVLDKIKEARVKNSKSDELYNTTYYQMLVPWGEKHPVLFFLLMRIIRARWWGVTAYHYGDAWEKKEKGKK
jgi:hypothetical protein